MTRRSPAWRRLGIVALMALVTGLGAWGRSIASAKNEIAPAVRSSRASKDKSGGRGIEEMLTTMRTNQQNILKRLDEVLQELQYAKTRAR